MSHPFCTRVIKWLEAKIITLSPGLVASISIPKQNELRFDLGLFRWDETISLQALIEIPSAENGKNIKELLSKNLKWRHRIAETKNEVQQTSYTPYKGRSRYILGSMLFLSVSMIVGSLSSLFGFLLPSQQPKDAKIGYEITTKDNQKILVDFIPNLDGLSEIVGVDNKYSEKIEFEKFFSDYAPKPVVYTAPRSSYQLLFGFFIIYLLIGVFLLISVLIPYRNSKNLEKIINKSRNTSNSA